MGFGSGVGCKVLETVIVQCLQKVVLFTFAPWMGSLAYCNVSLVSSWTIRLLLILNQCSSNKNHINTQLATVPSLTRYFILFQLKVKRMKTCPIPFSPNCFSLVHVLLGLDSTGQYKVIVTMILRRFSNTSHCVLTLSLCSVTIISFPHIKFNLKFQFSDRCWVFDTTNSMIPVSFSFGAWW